MNCAKLVPIDPQPRVAAGPGEDDHSHKSLVMIGLVPTATLERAVSDTASHARYERTRASSSTEVNPEATFSNPSSHIIRIPPSIAARAISSRLA